MIGLQKAREIDNLSALSISLLGTTLFGHPGKELFSLHERKKTVLKLRKIKNELTILLTSQNEVYTYMLRITGGNIS